jgi:hypothetical protein
VSKESLPEMRSLRRFFMKETPADKRARVAMEWRLQRLRLTSKRNTQTAALALRFNREPSARDLHCPCDYLIEKFIARVTSHLNWGLNKR